LKAILSRKSERLSTYICKYHTFDR